MGLRLSKDLRAAQKATNGFDLVFTDSTTYDLDELLSIKKRNDGSRGLIVEVKKSDIIAKKAFDKLKNENNKIFSDNSEFEIRINEKLEELFSQVTKKYSCSESNVPKEGYQEIKSGLNSFLKELYSEDNISYNISFLDSRKILIDFYFTDDNDLNIKFQKYYDEFLAEYDKELSVSEGGLAISDRARKIRINRDDYKNYLLDEKSETTIDKKTGSPILSCDSNIVCWEDGSDDITTPDQVDTVYDDIAKILTSLANTNSNIRNLEEKINETNETIKKYHN